MEKTPFKQKIRSALRWIGWVLLVQFILVNISAALYADKLTRYYTDIPENYSNSNGNIFTKSWKLFTGPRYARPEIKTAAVFSYDTVQFIANGGLRIDAWYGRTDSVAKGTVIFFHGIGGTRISLLDEANEFRYMGMNVMLVDFRGHGNSGGNRTTIGIRESEEVKLAYEFIRGKGERYIFLYGTSMGAVAVAKALSDYKLQPAGVILDAPFLSLQAYLKARARMLGFPGQPFAFFTCFWIGAEKGFNGFGHATQRYAKNMHSPVLLQWGSLDDYVSEEDMRKISEAIPSNRKKLVIYEGAQHESYLRYDAPQWRKEIEAFTGISGQ